MVQKAGKEAVTKAIRPLMKGICEKSNTLVQLKENLFNTLTKLGFEPRKDFSSDEFIKVAMDCDKQKAKAFGSITTDEKIRIAFMVIAAVVALGALFVSFRSSGHLGRGNDLSREALKRQEQQQLCTLEIGCNASFHLEDCKQRKQLAKHHAENRALKGSSGNRAPPPSRASSSSGNMRRNSQVSSSSSFITADECLSPLPSGTDGKPGSSQQPGGPPSSRASSFNDPWSAFHPPSGTDGKPGRKHGNGSSHTSTRTHHGPNKTKYQLPSACQNCSINPLTGRIHHASGCRNSKQKSGLPAQKR